MPSVARMAQSGRFRLHHVASVARMARSYNMALESTASATNPPEP